jgi:hypothetical protein
VADADRPDDAEDRDKGPRRKQTHVTTEGGAAEGVAMGESVSESHAGEPDSGSGAVELDPEDT